jgi:hypothetical protein
MFANAGEREEYAADPGGNRFAEGRWFSKKRAQELLDKETVLDATHVVGEMTAQTPRHAIMTNVQVLS